MKKQVVYIVVTLLFCLTTLFVVNFYTKPLIAQTEAKNVGDNLRAVLDAFEFMPLIPETLWLGFDSTGNQKGIVFKAWPRGYGGVIPLTVGVDNERKIAGIRIGGKTEGFNETDGIGSKVRGNSFTKQFIGKKFTQISLKVDGGDIEAVTGATISSRAVCEGIKKGLQSYDSYLSAKSDDDTRYSIFPDAKIFIPLITDTLWYAVRENETLGLVFAGRTFGYLDTIKYLAGINKNGSIERVIITYSHETEGIGEQIRSSEFLDKFKTGIPDAISGATVSSKALINSIKTNSERFGKYLQ